ncbi:MAG: response regulator transcription factor [Burkholderiaceae bacterium]
MRLLVVEDDPGIATGLQAALKQAGHAVDCATTLAQAWGVLTCEPVDAVLLDLTLPDGDGMDLLRKIRARPAGLLNGGGTDLPRPDLPVLIMTARDAVPDRITGLDGGADDYLSKPFDVNELLARLRVAMRRAAGRASPLVTHGDVSVNPAKRTVEKAGQPVTVGAREFSVLLALMQSPGEVLDRARLEAAVYGFGEELDSNAIEVHIHHLRRKLGEGFIKTLRGVGYFIAREPGA